MRTYILPYMAVSQHFKQIFTILYLCSIVSSSLYHAPKRACCIIPVLCLKYFKKQSKTSAFEISKALKLEAGFTASTQPSKKLSNSYKNLVLKKDWFVTRLTRSRYPDWRRNARRSIFLPVFLLVMAKRSQPPHYLLQ